MPKMRANKDLCFASDGNQRGPGPGVEQGVTVSSRMMELNMPSRPRVPVPFFIIARTQKNEHNQPSNKNGTGSAGQALLVHS